MQWTNVAHLVPLLLATVIGSGLAYYTWQRRPLPGAGPMVVMGLATAVWSFFYALELASATLAAKVFWARLQYFGVVALPVAWYCLALEYTGREHRVTRRTVTLLALMPLSTLLLLWLSPSLIWSENAMVRAGSLSLFAPAHGPWFWVHTVYSYLLILFGLFMMVGGALRSPKLYRRQAAAFLVSVLLPLGANAWYVLGLTVLDLTPFGFALGYLVLAWGIFRMQLFDVMPVARVTIVESLDDPVLVLDGQNRIVDANPASHTLTGRAPSALLGRSLTEVVPSLAALVTEARAEAPAEVEIGSGQGQRVYLVRLSLVHDRRQRERGKLLLFHDISERRQRERELECFATVSRALRAANRREQMLPVILEQATTLLHAGGALLVTREGPACNRVEHASGGWSALKGEALAPQGLVCHLIAEGAFRTKDVRRVLDWPEATRLTPYFAVVGAPLLQADEATGAIFIGRRQPFTPAEARSLLAIAEIATNALSRAALLETVEQRVKERTRALDVANKRLRELDRIKSKLINDLSHELRTPVTTIRLYLNLLERGNGNTKERYLDVLNRQSERLHQVIEGVLRFSSLETQAAGEARQAVDLNQIVEAVAANHHQQAAAQQLQLSIQLDPSLPPTPAISELLTEALSHLVDNAVKYTPCGTITVATSYDRREQRVGICVQDTGMGISREELPHVFERFFRGQQVSQLTMAGAGLGLALVRQIVTLHQGEIEIESEPEEGTSIWLWLPAAPREQLSANGSTRLRSYR